MTEKELELSVHSKVEEIVKFVLLKTEDPLIQKLIIDSDFNCNKALMIEAITRLIGEASYISIKEAFVLVHQVQKQQHLH